MLARPYSSPLASTAADAVYPPEFAVFRMPWPLQAVVPPILLAPRSRRPVRIDFYCIRSHGQIWRDVYRKGHNAAPLGATIIAV